MCQSHQIGCAKLRLIAPNFQAKELKRIIAIITSTLIFCLLGHPVIGQQTTASFTSVQLSEQVGKTFPLKRSFDGVSTVFDKPVVLLDALEDRLEIRVQIDTTYKNITYPSSGILRGRIGYDSAFRRLEFEQVRLHSFRMFDVKAFAEADVQFVEKTLKQSLATNLPDILLVDFEELSLHIPRDLPKEVDIEPRRLTIAFK